MKQHIIDLATILKKQTDLYGHLLEVLEREKLIIVDSAVDDLFANNKKKEVLILQLRLLEESGANLLRKIFAGMLQDRGEPSVPRLIDCLNGPAAMALQRIYHRLLSVAGSVRELNAGNEQRINGALRAIKSSLSFLTAGLGSDHPVYEVSGQLKCAPAGCTLLQEEA